MQFTKQIGSSNEIPTRSLFAKEADIEVLMSRGLREGPQLEYKETLFPLSDNKKFELLKDVSSMANSDGGVIVFGVKQDQTAEPASLPGLEIEDVDELHNRLITS